MCQEMFFHRSRMEAHMGKHTGEKPFKCQICEKAYRYEYTMTHHMRIHNGGKPYSCVICNQTFTYAQGMRAHMQVTHIKGKPHSCEICSKMFSTKKDVECHIKITHRAETPYSCEVCSRAFKSKSGLRRHMKSHNSSGEVPQRCELCEATFTCKSSLRRHLKRHNGDKPFFCKICKKSFRDKYILETHMRTHTGERPYGCQICNKSFKKKSHLWSHSKVHTGERPHTCNVCQKAFKHKHVMVSHVIRVHAIEKPKKVEYCKVFDFYSPPDNHDSKRQTSMSSKSERGTNVGMSEDVIGPAEVSGGVGVKIESFEVLSRSSELISCQMNCSNPRESFIEENSGERLSTSTLALGLPTMQQESKDQHSVRAKQEELDPAESCNTETKQKVLHHHILDLPNLHLKTEEKSNNRTEVHKWVVVNSEVISNIKAECISESV